MGVKFRPMNRSDYESLGGFVRTTGSNDTFDQLSSSLDSTALFGDSDHRGTAIEQTLERMHRRATIALALPTFNYVTAQVGGKLLWKILGVKSSIGTKICKMEVAYDLESGELVDVNELTYGDRFLLGASIAKHYIDEFDFEKAIIEELENFICVSELKDGQVLDGCAEVVKGEGTYPLCGGYSLNVTNADVFYSRLKRGHSNATLMQNIRSVMFKTDVSRMTFLLNMNRDKSGLYGMLNEYIAVVPPEMRPKVQNKEHKLTTRYTAVISTNNELSTVLSSKSNPMDLQSKYLALDTAVSKLQYKHKEAYSSAAADDMSVLERVKGKKGQVRLRNLGKRVDYSGRAVVVVNPYLPLDMIALPECMLPSLLEFHVLPYLVDNIKKNNDSKSNGDIYSTLYDKIKLTDLQDEDARREIIDLIEKHHILDDIAIPLGRQPTLHKLGIQAFYCKISKSKAIEVNPLVCPAFNMDFDGDAGYSIVPLLAASIKEMRDLVLTTQNLYLPKTGECTIEPRQDMLYGLWMCTRDTYKKGTPVSSCTSLQEAREAVIRHRVKVWDTITVNGKIFIAGEAAFISCFPYGDVVQKDEVPRPGQINACEITSKTITRFINHVLRKNSTGNYVHRIGTRYASTETFVGCINHLVELGFKVGYLYIPNISLLQKPKPIPEYDNALKNYYATMEEFDYLYDMGLMTENDYSVEFNKALSILNKTLNDNIYEHVGEDNGFVKLAKSGARGKTANLSQMFAVKGMVKKNSNEAFDALLENSYFSQLTPLEHFVAAYGGRQGQIDKSLKTSDTGYASRQMWHTTSGMVITCEDCGTKEGISISKNYFTQFLDPDSQSYDSELEELFEHAIVGKWTVDDEFITEAKAKIMSQDDNVQEMTIRSPLRCNKPCCSKCYGMDWGSRKKAVVGSPIGIIAAQSIGEPASQLCMKQFQNGGVANASDVTSAFDKFSAYLHCVDLRAKSKAGKYSGYDPLAWDSGEVFEEPSSNLNEKKVRIGKPTGRSITMPSNIQLRKVAIKGEGLTYKHGDYSIHEVQEISGIDAAQKYLMYKLYMLYKSECDIMMIHFEVLVAMMSRFMIIESNRTDLKVGQFYTRAEMLAGPIEGVTYEERLLSAQSIVQVSQDALDTILMEHQGRGLAKVCALGMTDKLEKPLNRMLLGLTINCGSAIPGYIEERKDAV